MGDVARCSAKNEDLLYKLFGKNAELLIDHAWGWEPCTVEAIKAYKPSTNSLGSGQVLHCPYEAEKAKLKLNMVDGGDLRAYVNLIVDGMDREQLAAMEMMGVDPLRRIIVPRFLGAVISMPVLAIIFSAIGIIGSWFVGVQLIGTDNGAFWSQMQNGVDLYIDVVNSVIKSFVFGVIVGLVALFQGYSSRPTPDGVSRATTRTVVISSLLVLGVDFMMTALMFSGI